MTIFGVSLWRFAIGVIVSEAIPVLLLVIAMFPVGLAIGGRPSQETASAWGAWIGPIGGALATGVVAWMLTRTATNPVLAGLTLGIVVAILDLSLTLAATKAEPFRVLYAVSALSRLAGGCVGGLLAARSALPNG